MLNTDFHTVSLKHLHLGPRVFWLLRVYPDVKTLREVTVEPRDVAGLSPGSSFLSPLLFRGILK